MRRSGLIVAVAASLAIGGCTRPDEPGPDRALDAFALSDPAHSAPVGREFTVELDRPIGTDVSYAGDFFTATLTTPILATNGAVLVPAGAHVRGTVSQVTLDPPSVTVRFDTVHTDQGDEAFDAAVIGTPGGVGIKGGLRAVDESRFSTLTPREPVGVTAALPSAQPGFVADGTREQIRIPAGTKLRLMLTGPFAVPAAER
ncbi:MAG TPA: hypothetical protein VHB21_02450 [Minicystis sp.]|nr:hypothetical protein [Minicystis sp.]